MRIKIYIHPESKESFWARFSLRAVAAEILRKRYTPEYIENTAVTDIDFDKYFDEGEKRVLMYIGYSAKDTPNDLAYLSTHGVHTLMLNYGYEEFSSTCSRVLLDCRDATEKSIGYLLSNGRDRIALFGVNPNSSTDSLRSKAFSEYITSIGRTPEQDIYYNYGSMLNCREKLVQKIKDYNAVICVNEIAAFILLRGLKESGVSVPHDLYVISCGYSTMLCEQTDPTLTSVSADQSDVGTQAVLAYSSLMKNPGNVALTVKVAAKLSVGGSTDFSANMNVTAFAPKSTDKSAVNFFQDPSVKSFFSVEMLLLESDEIDRGILDGLIASDTYSIMAERLFTSENVISYRIKRMCKIAGTASKQELIELITPYLK